MLDSTWQEAYLMLMLNRNTILFQLNKVSKLFEKLEVKKATGLDNLPLRFLKIKVDILAPSRTFEFIQSISSAIVPIKWKLATVTPVFKRARERMLITTGRSRLSQLLSRFLKEWYTINYIVILTTIIFQLTVNTALDHSIVYSRL